MLPEHAIAILLLAPACAWLALFLLNARHWLAEAPMPTAESAPAGKTSVLVAARNEKHTIGLFLRALPPDAKMEIIVADDHSSDGTPEAVSAAAAADPRIKLLPPAPLAEGWTGKNMALWRAASCSSGEWLFFCDADIEFQPELFGKAAALAATLRLDALSLIPRMRAEGLAVSLLLVCLATVKALFTRPARPGRPGIAQGAFLLVRRSAYFTAGGHGAVRSEVLEDVALARRLAEAGFRVAAWPCREMLSTKMYHSALEARQGFAKHVFFFKGFGTAAKMALALLLCAMTFGPLGTAALCAAGLLEGATTLAATAVSVAAMYGVIFAVAAREKPPPAAAALFPLSLALAGAALLEAKLSGVRWKDRPLRAKPRQTASS